MKEWILVAGFGNPIMQDDGIGPKAIEMLRSRPRPIGVDLIDAGTSALDLVPSLIGKKLVVIIDAVSCCGKPGDIVRLMPDQILQQNTDMISLHSLQLPAAMKLWELQIDPLPKMVLYGVEPKNIGLGLNISAEAQAALPRLCELVLEEIALAIKD